MAEGGVYACSHCTRTVTAWDEGDPYYRDASGKKHYAYHPDPERDLCTGIDATMLCLNCGASRRSDAEAPPPPCRKCKVGPLVDVCELEGRTCPWCKQGTFARDPTQFMIS